MQGLCLWNICLFWYREAVWRFLELESRRHPLPVSSKTWKDCNIYRKHQSEAGLFLPRKPSAGSQWWWVFHFSLLRRVVCAAGNTSLIAVPFVLNQFVKCLHVWIFVSCKAKRAIGWALWVEGWSFEAAVGMRAWPSSPIMTPYLAVF